MELLPGDRTVNLVYVDNIFLLSDDLLAVQNALNRLTMETKVLRMLC